MQKSVEDEQLLQGAVPQLADWLRVWRMCREPQSWLAAEHVQITEQYISQIRTSNVKRRALQSMAFVAREVTRMKKRDIIRSMTYISYAFDERDGHLCLRYRCDVPPFANLQANTHCTTAWGVVQKDGDEGCDLSEQEAMKLCHSCGIIGVCRSYHDKGLEKLTDNWAKQTAEDVIDLIRDFCTPYKDVACDASLFEAMKRKCISIAVDGAGLPVARVLLEKYMTNMIIICRDASHAIRIACKEPLQRTGGFQAQHYELFQKKCALMKNLHFSNKLKGHLEACQQCVLATEGQQGAGLKKIMQNLSYAPQRWDGHMGGRIRRCVAERCALLCAIQLVHNRPAMTINRYPGLTRLVRNRPAKALFDTSQAGRRPSASRRLAT